MKKSILSTFFVFMFIAISTMGQNKLLRSDYVVTPSFDTIFGAVHMNNGFRLIKGDIRLKDTIGKKDNFFLKDFISFSKYHVPYRAIFDDRYSRKKQLFYGSIVYPGSVELLSIGNPEHLNYEEDYLKSNKKLSRFAYYPVIDYYLSFEPDEGAFQVNRKRYKAKLIAKLGDNKELVKWVKNRKFDYTQIPKLIFKYNGGDFISNGKWLNDFVVLRNGDTIFGQVNLSRRIKIYPEGEKRYNRYAYNQLQSFRWFSADYKCLKLDRHRDKKPYWHASKGKVNLYIQGVNQNFVYDARGNIIAAEHDSKVYYIEKNKHFYGPLNKLSVKRQIKALMGECPEIEKLTGSKMDLFENIKYIVDFYNNWYKLNRP